MTEQAAAAIRTILANASLPSYHFVRARPMLGLWTCWSRKYHNHQNHSTPRSLAMALELRCSPSIVPFSAFSNSRASPLYFQFVISRNSSQATTSSLDKNYIVKDKKKKTLEPVKIMLISETDNVTVVTLDEATKIAHRRGLHLTKLDNSDGKIHTEKQVFKLVKLSEIEDGDVRQAKKGGSDNDPEAKANTGHAHKDVKTLIVQNKIGEHDLLSKVKNIVKWVQKGHRVHVFINSSTKGSGDVESVFQTIENNVKEYARVFNKQQKGKDIRFQIEPLPVKAAAVNTSTSTSESAKA